MRLRYLIAVGAAALTAYYTAGAAGSSPVADAAMKGDVAAVKALIQQKADVNAPQADGATALQWAAYDNNLPLADVLLAAGADVKKANREGATPMYLASIRGSAPMIEKLLKAGSDPNEAGPQGESPLMLAARNGNLDAIKVLIDHKANVNGKEELRGTTPIMWAASEGHADAMKLLIASGADINAVSKPDSGGKPRNNLANPVSQRLNSGFGVNGQKGAAKGAVVAVGANGAPDFANASPEAAAIAAGLTPNPAAPAVPGAAPAAPANGQPAAAGGRGNGRGGGRGRGAGGGGAAAVGAALPNGEAGGAGAAAGFGGGRGRGGGAADGGGLTPLVYAAREDCLDCAKALVEAGANVNQVTNYGWTALLTATQNRHYVLAAYLLDHGANPNISNKGGWSPLYLATDNRNIEAGDYPVRAPDMDHLAYIKLLIEKGANVNARICGPQSTTEKCTGDTTETRTNFTMQWLFEDGATPFLRAAQSGDVELMKLLLAHGADPKIFTAHNVTPLAVAAGIGWVEGVTYEWSEAENVEAVKMCLDLGIDPNQADDEGRTSLHGAAHKGRPVVIQMLVDHGANMEAHDFGSRDSVNGGMLGQTWIPIDWARGLVRVGVQSAIAHPEAEKLLVKLMTEKGLKVPAPPTDSRCLTTGVKGCS
jgi:ankyrin repeat protein